MFTSKKLKVSPVTKIINAGEGILSRFYRYFLPSNPKFFIKFSSGRELQFSSKKYEKKKGEVFLVR